jgi:uncharacterized protein (TIGR02118 family)
VGCKTLVQVRGQARPRTTPAVKGESPMQRVTVAYPNKTDAKFDFDYYMKKHIPMVAGLVGKSIEVRRGISSVTGSPAAFVCLATIPIDSVTKFQALLSQHGTEILADIPNYTNIEPIIQFDEILA